MHKVPRFDLQRAEVDAIFTQCINDHPSFERAHALFSQRINAAFSPLTECAAIAYASTTYHSDIAQIEQYFNVEKSGCFFDVLLIIAEKGSVKSSKKLFQHAYACPVKAMETCRVLNTLFNLMPADTAHHYINQQ